MTRFAVAALLAALAAPAHAHDERAPAAPSILGGIVEERDAALLFDYLRGALDAAVEGREAPPPEALARRAEAIGEDLKRRGVAAARVLIDAIEKRVREELRDPAPRPALPPSYPARRI